MGAESNELTNARQMDYVPFISSVMPLQSSILPDRFTSTSEPIDTPLVSPGLNSDSGPKEQFRRISRDK